MPHCEANAKQQMHSIYAAECVCGHAFETREPESRCLYCGRLLVIEWRGRAVEEVTSRKEEERCQRFGTK